jgi:hypothetical protein
MLSSSEILELEEDFLSLRELEESTSCSSLEELDLDFCELLDATVLPEELDLATELLLKFIPLFDEDETLPLPELDELSSSLSSLDELFLDFCELLDATVLPEELDLETELLLDFVPPFDEDETLPLSELEELSSSLSSLEELELDINELLDVTVLSEELDDEETISLMELEELDSSSSLEELVDEENSGV